MFRTAKCMVLLFLLTVILVACTRTTTPDSDAATTETLEIVVSTSIIGDVVRNVAGDAAAVTVLIPIGTDPHSFEPTPQDTTTMADADIIFINGLGLEEPMRPMLNNVSEEKIVELSAYVETIEFQGEHDHEGEGHENGSDDPHVWMDPNNVIVWTEIIAGRLASLDPDNAETYAVNAEAYRAELKELDAWIQQQVTQVPKDNRALVTDHAVFTYFAEQYGFEKVGAVFPGFSTLSEPSAQELAELQDVIDAHSVPALFVGTTVNPQLAEQIAADTGIVVRQIYTGSLSEEGGPADTYIKFMQYNVATIVDALK